MNSGTSNPRPGGLLASVLGRLVGRPAPEPAQPAAPASLEPPVADLPPFERLAPLGPDTSRLEVLATLYKAVEYAIGTGVDGHVAEFGTMTGETAAALAKSLADFGQRYGYSDAAQKIGERHLYLFDSFEGLPDDMWSVDQESLHVRSGVWAPHTCKGIDPQTLLSKIGHYLPADRVRIMAGWFSATLPKIPAGTVFSVVHIDSDLYSSAFEVLDYLFAKKAFANGCMVLFDDWDCNAADPRYGERRAWRECVDKYQAEVSDMGSYGWGARRFIVHRRD